MTTFLPMFLDALDLLVQACPFISCDSWGRSVDHNANVGGAPSSQHRWWNAVDLTCDQESQLIVATKKAMDLGFRGIELDYRNNHLHLDWRADPWHRVFTKDGRQLTLDDFLTKGGNDGNAL